MNTKTKNEDEIIFTYTSKQAEDDGVLFDITRLNKEWKDGLFNYVTTNLLSKGYFDDIKGFNIPCVLDLLNQSMKIVKEKSQNMNKFDTFFDGQIELPSGEKQKVFIEQNETEKFTIMLPEDR